MRPPETWSPAQRRDFELYYAGVLTREAEARSGTTFSASLLEWADNARRRADAIDISPAQADLFGARPIPHPGAADERE